DNSNYIGVGRSKNDRYLLIYSQATLSNEVLYVDASKPNENFKIFQPRMKNVLYDVISLEDRFLILTNWDALNFRLMECAIGNTGKENWKEVIPHRTDVLLSGVEEFKDFLVISEREKGLVNLR